MNSCENYIACVKATYKNYQHLMFLTASPSRVYYLWH
jgi:hypothetical protein